MILRKFLAMVRLPDINKSLLVLDKKQVKMGNYLKNLNYELSLNSKKNLELKENN